MSVDGRGPDGVRDRHSANRAIWHARAKKAYLPDLAQAKRSVCFAVTEAHAGSDVAAIRTTALRDGSDWILNGTKALIGNARGADLCIVAAKTDPNAGHTWISLFAVEANARL